MTPAVDDGGHSWVTLRELLLACVLQVLIVQLLPAVVAAPGSRYEVPNDFEVVYVSHVDSDGVLLSRDIQHDRLRRSLRINSHLHLNVSGKNQQFQLELISNRNLLAPGFQVYHRNSGVNFTYSSLGLETTVLSEFHKSAECVYTGHLIPPSRQTDVAITLCDGMRGLIRTATEDYVIEPMPLHLAYAHMPHEQQPHIMYKRSSLNRQHTRYFESQNYNSGSTEWQPFSDQYSGHHRRKRSSRRRVFSRMESTVETLVVVDKDMYRNHGKENITTYVLSMFNIVSKLFNDNSIGSEVNIVLTGLILLEADEPGLHVQHLADQTLNSFCQWQSALSSSDGRHHDHAILLTGLDICSYKDAPCDTLGFAPIKGMCNRLRSCTINEDTGLSTAFTISHEIGHNLGMFHDGEGNYCQQVAGNIMSPTLTGQNGVFRWSSCSRIYLFKFLSTLQADCLGDRPNYVSELKFPDRLPGEIYNADVQCQWQFGSRARICKYDFGSYNTLPKVVKKAPKRKRVVEPDTTNKRAATDAGGQDLENFGSIRGSRRRSSRIQVKSVDAAADTVTEATEDDYTPRKRVPANRPNVFGAIPDVEIGMIWDYRTDCCWSGVHRPTVAGIHGSEEEGTYSIALSGGYEDDLDLGECFTYTGSGGRDLKGTKANPKNLRTAVQTKDQTLTGANLALSRNVENGRPVRVIRGYKLQSAFAPEEGYRYDGLYSVEKFWSTTGMSGFGVWKYALKRCPDQPPPPWKLLENDNDSDQDETVIKSPSQENNASNKDKEKPEDASSSDTNKDGEASSETDSSLLAKAEAAVRSPQEKPDAVKIRG